jgi:hypothetical protein
MVVTLKILNRNLSIPWLGIEKELLLTQVGLWDKSVTDKEGVSRIENRTNKRLLDLYEILSQLPQNSTILDIGSGNSLIDLSIQLMFPEKNFKFILVDDNVLNLKKNSKFYDEKNYKTYNNWSFVNKVIELNQFDNKTFDFKLPNDVWTNSQVDLIISSSSWGWHYPIDTYLDKILSVCNNTGYIYINPLLNIDNALDKIAIICNSILKQSSSEFKEAFSPLENARINLLIRQGRVPKDRFQYTFLGKINKG